MTNRTALRLGLAAALATALSACGGAADPGATTTTARIGAQGGVVTTSSGFSLSIPSGALSREVEIEIHEFRPEDGALHRIELEPRGTQLELAAHVEMHHGADDSPTRMVEMENEVEHAMENEQENEVEHSREAEIHHLGVIELRHARTCAVPCDAGLECDDGICKAHGGR